MLTPTVAQLITEDRIREAEAARTARPARPPRTRAPRLRRMAWPFAGHHSGTHTSAPTH